MPTPITNLVYVHGTNGSGKSTLARSVVAAAGGVSRYVPNKDPGVVKCGATHTSKGIVLMGKYGSACGGVDGIQPYAALHDELQFHCMTNGARVFAEGLVTPGLSTCVTFASYFGRATFILLDVPEEECIRNVLKRRNQKGTTKEYDPANLYRKAKSARNWADRLERAGLEVHRLQFMQAYKLSLELLGLQLPNKESLLKGKT